MYGEEDCGCGGHGKPHGERYEERQEGPGEDCGCGGHGHHSHYADGMNMGWHRHGGCGCRCHHYHGGMGFHRHFIPREEIIPRLEEYLKQIQAEAKGVEERIAELRKKDESQKA